MENTLVIKEFNPEISVVVPVYNVERYLSACVDSILNQSLTNFELILVDDGSTDKSGSMCDYYSSIDNRVIVIHKNNGGLSSARNAGIDESRAPLIAFVDSDDFVHKDFLKTLYFGLTKNNCDISAIYRLKFRKEEELFYELPDDKGEIFVGLNSYYHAFKERANLSIVPNKLYKKSLFDGLRFPVGYYHEDYYLTSVILTRCKSMWISNSHFYYYRKHEGSILTNNTSLDLLRICNLLIEFYSNEYIHKERLNQTIIVAYDTIRIIKQDKKIYISSINEIRKLKKNIKSTRNKKLISGRMFLLTLVFNVSKTVCFFIIKKAHLVHGHSK